MSQIEKVDGTNFSRMIVGLMSIAGKTAEEVTRFEAGKVLGLCVKYTDAPKAKSYPRKKTNVTGIGFASAGTSELWINTTGKKSSPLGQVWLVEPGKVRGKTCYLIAGPGGSAPISNHPRTSGKPLRWSDARWGRAQSLQRQADPNQKLSKEQRKATKALRGRGLAKQSWAWIARAIGIPVDPAPPDYVLKAIPQDGKKRESGTGREIASPGSFLIELVNKYPLLCGAAKKPSENLDGADIIQRAMDARTKAFIIAVEKGVFNDPKASIERYGGILS